MASERPIAAASLRATSSSHEPQTDFGRALRPRKMLTKCSPTDGQHHYPAATTPVLRCQTACFTKQDDRYRTAKRPPSQCAHSQAIGMATRKATLLLQKRQANEPTLALKHGPAANSQQPTAPPGGPHATRGRCIARAGNTSQPQRPKLLSNSIMVRTSRFSSTWLHGMLSSRACICSVTGRIMPAHSS